MEQRDGPIAGGVDYDPETETYSTAHDWEERGAPSRDVLETVAAATGADPLELQPLTEVIDLEALDDLFDTKFRSASRQSNGRVTFRYEGCDVTVEVGGRTVVSTPPGDRQ